MASLSGGKKLNASAVNEIKLKAEGAFELEWSAYRSNARLFAVLFKDPLIFGVPEEISSNYRD